ncbi:MAG: DNA replication protein [Rhodospirillaceae bacterium]|nr:DNA replication protein [Rhodospirillaceae bacterium]
MTTQLPLSLPLPSAYNKESFVIGSANEQALSWLERWPDWPLPFKGLNLYGPPGSGKTHLSYLWAGRGDAVALNGLSQFDQDQFLQKQHVVLDDFGVSGCYDDTAVFHLLNYITSVSGTLLFLSPYPVAQHESSLSDLTSRLRSVAAQEIDLPDDGLLKAVLAKHFTDRQCAVSEQVLNYIVNRMERSFSAAQKLSAEMDALALSLKVPVSLTIARQVLDSIEVKLI